MQAKITVDFSKATGKTIKPLHGFNSGPMTKVFTYDARSLFIEGGFPYVRLHDVEYPYGSGEFVDIPCIFRNFDADENDPANYNFALTDEYIRQSLLVGSRIIYRLGVSIEHAPVKRYTYPPADFGKWARICEHIIRHYNKGWANGFHWNIEYWEIWNEAELGPKMWLGSHEQFCEMYVTAARHLKACFPNLKIGGCGWVHAHDDFVEGFLKYISSQKEPVPYDFHSWHLYADNAEAFVKDAAIARAALCRYGFADAESILDEWNLMYGWDRPNQAESYRAMKDHRGSAFYAAALCALQEQTDVSIATNFEADVVKEFCGIFNVREMCIGGLAAGDEKMALLEPTKGFYAFKWFNELYKLGDAVNIDCDIKDIWASAASNKSDFGLLIANQTGEQVDLQLDLRHIRGNVTLRVTDETHTDTVLASWQAEHDQLMQISLSPHAIIYAGTAQ